MFLSEQCLSFCCQHGPMINRVCLINVVALFCARLVPEWLSVFGLINRLGKPPTKVNSDFYPWLPHLLESRGIFSLIFFRTWKVLENEFGLGKF